MNPEAVAFEAIGATHRILATDPATLPEALGLAREHLAALDAAASRFRPDSEVSLLAARLGHERVRAEVSPLLAGYLRVALDLAERTDGLVDPTVGGAVRDSGYDRDIAEVRARVARAAGAGRVPGWREVELDGCTVTVPTGTLLDLGATGKAHAADVIAATCAEQLPGGFLVDLGGDVAVAGDGPDGGWRVGVELADGTVPQVVTTDGSALATSSTRLRRWRAADGDRHHVVDPRTGRTAPHTWAQVTCAAESASLANAMSTAAVVLGPDAPAWLAARGIAARLDTVDRVVVATPRWPVRWEHGEEAA